MPNYPMFQLPDSAVKMRFREQYVTEGENWKMSGVVPFGIYRGYTPNVGADPNVLLLNTYGLPAPPPLIAKNDSVAVAELPTTNYNVTVRSDTQIQLDFSGHTVFPVWVVLRTSYSITSHPYGGATEAKFVTINTLTVNDSDAQALHNGDVKICRINGLPLAGNIDTTVPTNRDDNGGPLVTQTQITSVISSLFKASTITKTNGNFSTSSTTFVDVPDTLVSFSTSLSGFVVFLVTGSFRSGTYGAQLGVKVNGSEYPITWYDFATFAGGVGMNAIPAPGSVPVNLTTGSHNANIIVRRKTVWGGSAVVSAASDAPLILTVLHT